MTQLVTVSDASKTLNVSIDTIYWLPQEIGVAYG